MHVQSNTNIILEEKALSEKRYYRSGTTLFFSFYGKNKLALSIAFIFLITASLGQTLPAVLTGLALDELKLNGFGTQFLILSGSILLISLVYLIAGSISMYILFKVASVYERDIRQEYFDVIQSHSLTFHDENNSSKLLSMGMTEIQQMRMGIFPSQLMLFGSFFAILLSLWFLNEISPMYSIITITGVLVYIFFAYRVSRKISPVRRQLAIEVGNLTESSQEIFRGIEVVRGLSAGEREKQKFGNQSQNYASLMETEAKFQAFYIPSLILLGVTAIIFSLALIDVSTGVITIGTLITAVALLLGLQMSTRIIPAALLMVQAGLINSERIWTVLNWIDPQPDEALESEGLERSINWKGVLAFDNVSFSYNSNGKKAVRNISFDIPGGSKIAIIGGPGGGKSTMLKLFLRLYDPQQGIVSIDGHNYAEIPATLIRKHVSRVEQDIFLFSGTVRDNIAFSKPDATAEEIITVAKAAQAHEFIEQMPQHYDSIIGERGVTLSGGQKQRIAIARALLADPDILLLDDSVSAVDSQTEYFLRKALDNLMAKRTSFTVTQRLITLVNADKILVLDKGEIIAFGTHVELLHTSSEYRRIFELLPKSEQGDLTRGGAN